MNQCRHGSDHLKGMYKSRVRMFVLTFSPLGGSAPCPDTEGTGFIGRWQLAGRTSCSAPCNSWISIIMQCNGHIPKCKYNVYSVCHRLNLKYLMPFRILILKAGYRKMAVFAIGPSQLSCMIRLIFDLVLTSQHHSKLRLVIFILFRRVEREALIQDTYCF